MRHRWRIIPEPVPIGFALPLTAWNDLDVATKPIEIAPQVTTVVTLTRELGDRVLARPCVSGLSVEVHGDDDANSDLGAGQGSVRRDRVDALVAVGFELIALALGIANSGLKI